MAKIGRRNLKIGVVIPTRGDRPVFLKHALKQIRKQTLQPDFIEIVDFKPTDDQKDITKRYKFGCEALKNKVDFILFIEDDDWYSDRYIEIMFKAWLENKKPDIIGIGETTYYHIKTKKYATMNHPERASAMNTAISSKMINKICWPKDNEPFFDLYLWESKVRKKTIKLNFKCSIGIKHGIGLTGGIGHNENFCQEDDSDGNWLLTNTDEDSFLFYNKTMLELKNSNENENENENIRFGILIATYYREDGKSLNYLSKALESIKNQTYKKYKIFIIGDKYEFPEEIDNLINSLELKNVYFENLPIAKEREKYEGETLWNYGGVNACNYGIKKALSENYSYICHLDHDDWWEQDHLESINKCILETKSDWICTKSTYKSLSSFLPKTISSDYYINFLPQANKIVHSSVCMDFKKIPLLYRDIYEETGQSSLPADADLWERTRQYIISNNLKSIFINKKTCNHIEENMNPKIYLHIGCGKNYFPGWMHLDENPRFLNTKKWKASEGLPYKNNSVTFIYSEHFLEHLSVTEGLFFLRECHRTLAPNGVVRIAMPNLYEIIKHYLNDTWYKQQWVSTRVDRIQTGAEYLNVSMRDWDHKWLYDDIELKRRLNEAGFVENNCVCWGTSDYPELCKLETRPETTLIYEAKKI